MATLIGSLGLVAHGGAPAGGRPDRRHQRTGAQALGREINPTIYDEREFDARRESAFLHEVLTGPLIVLRGT